MKKLVFSFSMTVIIIFSMYIGYKMDKDIQENPTYNGIAQYMVDDTREKTGAINAVTSIVFDFRGYDTLGESFVLFTAVTGVVVILRKNKKNGGH